MGITSDTNSSRIAVVGAGMMGQGIAQQFASRGFQVALTSLDDEPFRTVLDRIRADLSFIAERGLGDATQIEGIVARIVTTPIVEEALENADFVVECIFEDLAAKRELFSRMEPLVRSDVILATNTSVIRIGEIASACRRPERVIGTHWWNPAFLVPLVEVIPGPLTSSITIEGAVRVMRSAGKKPVVLNKDAPGFVGNRLMFAMYREAFYIAEEGIASLDAVDEILKLGPGMRFPVLGPFAHADMIGLDLVSAIGDYLFQHLNDVKETPRTVRERVGKGALGFKSRGNGLRTWTTEDMLEARRALLEHLVYHLSSRSGAEGDKAGGNRDETELSEA